MDWINENLQVLSTLVSALSVYIMLRKAAKKDTEVLKKEMEQINIKLDSVNIRLTRLEGRFEERGYWESRITGTEHKK